MTSKMEAVTKVIEETIIEKAYELRGLKDSDLWPILDIIAKVFPDDLSTVFAQIVTKEKSVQEVGAIVMTKLVVAVCKNIKYVREEVYCLLSDVSGIPAETIADMEFGTTPMMIMDIAKDAKNASFFKVLSKLL